jgi:hypothetical protein
VVFKNNLPVPTIGKPLQKGFLQETKYKGPYNGLIAHLQLLVDRRPTKAVFAATRRHPARTVFTPKRKKFALWQ